MTTPPLTIARTLRPPRRLDLRLLTGLLLALIALGGSLAFWSTTRDTRDVLVLTRDLPAGSILTSADLTTTAIRMDEAVYQAAVPAGDLAAITGKQLAGPGYAHQLLVRAQLATHPLAQAGQVVATIAVTPESADGGHLQPGDAVQVLVTTGKGTPQVQTRVVLTRAVVADLGFDQATAVLGSSRTDSTSGAGTIRWIALVVSPEEAQQLATAKWSGELDVLLLPAVAEPGH